MKVGGSSDSSSLDKLGRGTSRGVEGKSGSGGGIAPAPAPIATSGSEGVSFSDLSSKLQELEKSLSASTEFDAGRVDAIKQAIRDGKFLVDSGVVADKLLQSVQELFGKTAAAP